MPKFTKQTILASGKGLQASKEFFENILASRKSSAEAKRNARNELELLVAHEKIVLAVEKEKKKAQKRSSSSSDGAKKDSGEGPPFTQATPTVVAGSSGSASASTSKQPVVKKSKRAAMPPPPPPPPSKGTKPPLNKKHKLCGAGVRVGCGTKVPHVFKPTVRRARGDLQHRMREENFVDATPEMYIRNLFENGEFLTGWDVAETVLAARASDMYSLEGFLDQKPAAKLDEVWTVKADYAQDHRAFFMFLQKKNLVYSRNPGGREQQPSNIAISLKDLEELLPGILDLQNEIRKTAQGEVIPRMKGHNKEDDKDKTNVEVFYRRVISLFNKAQTFFIRPIYVKSALGDKLEVVFHNRRVSAQHNNWAGPAGFMSVPAFFRFITYTQRTFKYLLPTMKLAVERMNTAADDEEDEEEADEEGDGAAGNDPGHVDEEEDEVLILSDEDGGDDDDDDEEGEEDEEDMVQERDDATGFVDGEAEEDDEDDESE